MVYFIEAIGTEKIKIGSTTNLNKRLEALQNGSPVPLKVLITLPGDKEQEKDLHTKYQTYRHHGEWFAKEGELKDFLYYSAPEPASLENKIKTLALNYYQEQTEKGLRQAALLTYTLEIKSRPKEIIKATTEIIENLSPATQEYIKVYRNKINETNPIIFLSLPSRVRPQRGPVTTRTLQRLSQPWIKKINDPRLKRFIDFRVL